MMLSLCVNRNAADFHYKNSTIYKALLMWYILKNKYWNIQPVFYRFSSHLALSLQHINETNISLTQK